MHAYFESEIVDAQDLSLDDQVYRAALPRRDVKSLLASIPAADKSDAELLPLVLAHALVLDSHNQIASLAALDRKAALQKASMSDHGMHVPATRTAAAKVAAEFQPLLVQRLSLGAQTLAYLWTAAYRDAGSPDLSRFRSYVYPVAPAFIPPNYLSVTH